MVIFVILSANRKKISFMRKQKLHRILLLRTDRIGDVVLTTPVVSILRNYFPGVQMTFMANSYTKPLLACHRHINHIICYDPKGKHKGLLGHFKLAKEIKKANFDAAIFFYPRPWLALVVRLASIPLRIGHGYRWYSFLFNRRIFEHRKSGHKHELIHNLSLLKPLIGDAATDIRFEFDIPENVLQKRENLFKTKGVRENNYIILHPGNGGSAPNLSLTQYQFIVRHLLKKTKLQIILTGAGEESSFVNEIIEPFKSLNLFNLAGKLTMQMLMAVIADARIFIATSTGPLHIANAFGIPIIGFYCPSKPCAPDRWGPFFQQDWVLTPDVIPCDHCDPGRCPNSNCLEKIPAKSLKEIIDRRINNLQSTSYNESTSNS